MVPNKSGRRTGRYNHITGRDIWRGILLALVFVGATVPLSFVWNLSDAFNGLMAIPNLIALVTLSPVIFGMLRKYEDKEAVELVREEGEIAV